MLAALTSRQRAKDAGTVRKAAPAFDPRVLFEPAPEPAMPEPEACPSTPSEPRADNLAELTQTIRAKLENARRDIHASIDARAAREKQRRDVRALWTYI